MYEKVFGIGLNKTGTKTLGECLRHFGFNHMSCRRDLLEAFRAHRWDEVFGVTDQYDSFEDWPYPLMYRELFAAVRVQGSVHSDYARRRRSGSRA